MISRELVYEFISNPDTDWHIRDFWLNELGKTKSEYVEKAVNEVSVKFFKTKTGEYAQKTF